MKRMIGARCNWIQCLKRLKQQAHLKPFCTKTKLTSSNNGDGGGGKNANGSGTEDAYRQLDKLDFMTAAKILFMSPPKNKNKFGLDFHLVQLFFTCLPSLAVYLVAQYARYEIRRMEAELEVKKAREEEEEAKAKELESNGDEEKVAEIPSEILKVNERLDKLEETIKEIVSEPRKQAGLVSKDHQKDDNNNNITSEKRPQKITESNHSSSNEDSANEKMKRSAEPETVSSPVDQRDNKKKT